MRNEIFELDELVNNPTARVPICLCLDVSTSMEGKPIDELNEGVSLFYESIKNDETALYAAEICIVTFGGDTDEAKCLYDFSGLTTNSIPPKLFADGNTPMGEGVNLALDLLEKRKNKYKENGVDYYQPWLVLMTDGEPNGSNHELSRAINRTVDSINNKKLTIFPIGIGEHADMDMLKKFSPNRQPLRLKGLKFKEFFSWLSKSVSKVSQSMPGEKVNLDSVQGWGEL